MGKMDSLWQYHEALDAYEQLEKKVMTTPSRLQYNKLRAFLSEQQKNLTGVQKELDGKRAVVDKLREQFTQLEYQYDLELSEFQTMQDDPECTAEELTECRMELEGLMEELNAARRELYDSIVWIEKAGAESKETLLKAARAKKKYDVLRGVCEEELQAIKAELDAARAKVDLAAKAVPPALLARYARIKKTHAIPMARLENNQCSGCNMSLPTVVTKRVASENAIVECENCGRILYL